MVATFSAVTLCCVVLLATVQAFSPTNAAARCSVRGSTIVMDGKTRDLRDRIKSIKNTRRITEAMRLVAAARVRRAQEAVLKTRPLISQLQMVSLIISIHLKRYPIAFRYNDSHSVRWMLILPYFCCCRFLKQFWMHVRMRRLNCQFSRYAMSRKFLWSLLLVIVVFAEVTILKLSSQQQKE